MHTGHRGHKSLLLLLEGKGHPDQRQERVCTWLAASITWTRLDSDHKGMSGRWMMESQGDGGGILCRAWEYRIVQFPLATNPKCSWPCPPLLVMEVLKRVKMRALLLLALELSSKAAFSLALLAMWLFCHSSCTWASLTLGCSVPSLGQCLGVISGSGEMLPEPWLRH